MTITDFHITYQIPLPIINYAIKSGMLYIQNDHLLEDANFRRFLVHSELFTEQSMQIDVTTFWKRCKLVYEDKNYRIYDHRKKTGRNYYTVFTRDGGLIETFTSLIIAKKWAKARYAMPARKSKKYKILLTLEQMDYIANSGSCIRRPDIVDDVNDYLSQYIREEEQW